MAKISPDTLLRQASMTSDTYFREAVRNIDDQFGKGYAAANPSLVGAMVHASTLDFNNAILTQALEEIAAGLAMRDDD